MGLFGLGAPKESDEEISARIRGSEAGQTFTRYFCNMFRNGSEIYQWLMANSKERMCELNCFKEGVQLKRIEVNQVRLKQTGTYDVDTQGWSFGASGYQDLPNSKYVREFETYLLSEIKTYCPDIKFVAYNKIMLNESVKKGW